MITKALILAAGKGQRMKPLSDTRNKCLLPVANKPIISRSLSALKQAGISEVLIVVNPESEVEKALGSEQEGVSLSYAIQAKPIGTANAIGLAKDKFTEDFLVLNGDDFSTSEHLKNVMEAHKTKATVSITKKVNPKGLGVVEVEMNFVKSLVEKPEHAEGEHFVNVGIYAFSPEIFKVIDTLEKSKRGEYEITDAITKLIPDGVTVIPVEYWRSINYPWELITASKKFIDEAPEENKATVEEFVHVTGKLVAGEGTVIKSGVYIEGPVIIGKNCTIGPNAFIRPYTCIGDNCKIGQGVEVKNSIVMNGTCIPHLSYVGDSVIGQNVNFGAGAIMTNLRHDDNNVLVNVKGKQVDTGLRKLGGIVGDNVKFGSNVVINPGKKIGAGSRIWPGVVIYKDVEENTEYKG
ncbi:MAG: sugar phosphate nucleotidyltransferase [Candidatus Undinarchaeales archaeon]|jgi:bifunctional UDP-N-acetylglucosamine pyrophosphorylase/glucosamine-1-phosphate N-acetyltransferase|nr:sugar phosphate nucleotidyltransferase [Candidatus Undinarchaeales archaeon]